MKPIIALLVITILSACTPLPVSPDMKCKFTPGCEDITLPARSK